MRHEASSGNARQALWFLLICLSAWWSLVLPTSIHAQSFVPAQGATIANTPVPPGQVYPPNTSGTIYITTNSQSTPFLSGNNSSGLYDAIALFKRSGPDGSISGVPAGWSTVSGWIKDCTISFVPPFPHVSFQIRLIDLNLNVLIDSVTPSGSNCYSGGTNHFWDQALHPVGPTNNPQYPPLPPAKAKNPGDRVNCGAGDPCDTRTGLYYQQDTDIEVPDVLPIRLTRIYRTEDTAPRVFGIGASHPYDQYLLRNDLCSEVRAILPDGAYIAFLRTSGTNCLDSTLQHTTTQTEFYGATLAWDPTLLRYRLNFKDGTEWRFSEYGSLVAMLDRNGNTLTLTRAFGNGLAGNLSKITTPNGRYLTFTYDTSNRITQVTDILGRTILYTYDASGRLWKVTNPMSGVSEYTYDASHRLLTAKEPNGNTHVTNVYDANGRVQTQTQADNTTYQFAYTDLPPISQTPP